MYNDIGDIPVKETKRKTNQFSVTVDSRLMQKWRQVRLSSDILILVNRSSFLSAVIEWALEQPIEFLESEVLKRVRAKEDRWARKTKDVKTAQDRLVKKKTSTG